VAIRCGAIAAWEYRQFVEFAVLWRIVERAIYARLPVERIDERSM